MTTNCAVSAGLISKTLRSNASELKRLFHRIQKRLANSLNSVMR